MPVQADWLKSPLSIIKDIFGRLHGSSAQPIASYLQRKGEKELEVMDAGGLTSSLKASSAIGRNWLRCASVTESDMCYHMCDVVCKVPCLNATSLKFLHDGCLVSYTCMIQDQFDPEYFFKVLHTSTLQGSQVCLLSYPKL